MAMAMAMALLGLVLPGLVVLAVVARVTLVPSSEWLAGAVAGGAAREIAAAVVRATARAKRKLVAMVKVRLGVTAMAVVEAMPMAVTA